MFIIDQQWGNYVTLVDDTNLVAVVRNARTGVTLKTFRGETAWSDAGRYASDKHYGVTTDIV